MQLVAYWLYRLALRLLCLLPLGATVRLGRLLGRIAWLLPPYRAMILRNLRVAFGNLSESRLRALGRQSLATLGGNLLAIPKISTLAPAEIARRVVIENPDDAEPLFQNPAGLVIAVGHLSCWEIFALHPFISRDQRLAILYQPQRNPRIDAHIRATRARQGATLLSRGREIAHAARHLRAGGLVGLVSDQHAGDAGLWTPLFGRLASTTPLPALLAARAGVPILFAALRTGPRPGHWTIRFHPPVLPAGKDDTEAPTAALNVVLENAIRSAPHDWFWLHNRWKTPNPDFLLANYRRPPYLPMNMIPSELQPFRILLRSPNWLGDAVMAVPAVRAIARGRPDARIAVLAPAKIADLWRLVPEVHTVIPIPSGHGILSVARLLRRTAPFDVVVLFPNSLRAALEVWLARIPRRAGFSGHQRSYFLNQIIPEPDPAQPPLHQAEKYLAIAARLGAPQPFPDLWETPVLPSSAFSEFPAATSDAPPALLLCPGAEYGPAKRWPAENFAATAAQVLRSHPKAVWTLVGLPSDRPAADRIQSELPSGNVRNLVGQTSLTQLVALILQSRLLLTNDTGTMHLAALLGVPTVTIFGSTEPRLTRPLGPAHIALREHVPCAPCFLRECPFGHYKCLHSVTSGQAAEAALKALAQ